MYVVIYKITNIINGKIYIGITSNFNKRKTRHLSNALDLNCKSHLYLAMRKYGVNNFNFEEFCCTSTKEDGFYVEKQLIQHYKCTDRTFGYNMSLGGEGGSLGIKRTEAEKQHLSNFWKDKVFSVETKAKISAALTGKKISETTKEKLRISHLGKSPWNKGKKLPGSWNKGTTLIIDILGKRHYIKRENISLLPHQLKTDIAISLHGIEG